MVDLLTSTFAQCLCDSHHTYVLHLKIVESPDVSYNVAIMGLWMWVEVRTGIIVSCLPVMPKFFQRFGTESSQTFSQGSKAGFKLVQKMASSDSKNKIVHSGGTGGPETWGGLSPQASQYKGEYIALNEVDVLPPFKEDARGQRREDLAERQAKKRKDLDTGYHTI
jgi:hypothetical protein